jgi:hypothetical protein
MSRRHAASASTAAPAFHLPASAGPDRSRSSNACDDVRRAGSPWPPGEASQRRRGTSPVRATSRSPPRPSRPWRAFAWRCRWDSPTGRSRGSRAGRRVACSPTRICSTSGPRRLPSSRSGRRSNACTSCSSRPASACSGDRTVARNCSWPSTAAPPARTARAPTVCGGWDGALRGHRRDLFLGVHGRTAGPGTADDGHGGAVGVVPVVVRHDSARDDVLELVAGAAAAVIDVRSVHEANGYPSGRPGRRRVNEETYLPWPTPRSSTSTGPSSTPTTSTPWLYRAFRRYDITLPMWRLHRATGMGGDQIVAHVVGDEVERPSSTSSI